MQTNHQAAGSFPRYQRFAVLARWLCCLLFAIFFPCLDGCKPNKRYDLIEAELRTRERELSDTRAALEQARNLNRAFAQQTNAGAEPVAQNAPVYVPVKEITLARGTGGVFGEGPTGDDGLMVVVAPRDEDGAAVKVPARLEIAAWDISPAGLKTPIGNWAVPAEKVRPTWRSGFISTGYFVAVPWQTHPGSERVRIAVRLTTLDGRSFETDKDINVKLGGTSPRVNPPGPPPILVTPSVRPREQLFPDPLPPGTEELPPPSGAPGRGAKLVPPEKN
ncbi:MAG TPA: hypothetical protein VG097_06075 [Gemmata sp.]|jgi:hypothetical protein|nr:hypothetical protein [Gemmata sp.]